MCDTEGIDSSRRWQDAEIRAYGVRLTESVYRAEADCWKLTHNGSPMEGSA